MIHSLVIAYLILSGVATFLLAVHAWQRREAAGVRPFVGFLVTLAFYLIGYALKLGLPGLEAKLFGMKLEYLGVPLSPVFWFLLCLSFTGYESKHYRWHLAFFIIPVITVFLALTNSWHHLIYVNPHLQQYGPFSSLHFTKGIWYLVQIIYANLLMLAGIILLLLYLRHASSYYRRQALILLSGFIVPWVLLFVYLAGISPYGINIHACAMPFIAAVYAWGLFKRQLFTLAPVARNALVKSMPDAMLAFDQSGRLVDCNDMASRLFNFAPGSAMGMTARELLGEWTELIDALTTTEGQIECCSAPDGTGTWEITITEVTQRWGQGTGRLVVCHDISELKRTSDELRELNRTLELRVEAEIGRRLEQERIMAQQAKLMAMGEMLGAIAHQWRQPLATLGMNVQWFAALRKQRLPLADEWNEFETSSLHQIRHMSDTIDEFRDFYRSDKPRIRFPVTTSIAETVRLVAAQFTSHDIELRVTADNEPLPEVFGITGELTQVLLNLLANARDAIADIRHTNNSSVQGIITLHASGNERSVIVSVTDNGGGVPPEIAERIYEPSFTTRLSTGGSGIGLYLSRMIIRDRFDGILNHRCFSGGTTFVITLPVYRASCDPERSGL